ncbi:MAG: choice-of-anchor D domain-containing protein [Kofleriaceae bacterium]|nr:choice-of-anchor D domain-containing protein [Kofleriaceae bacterium]
MRALVLCFALGVGVLVASGCQSPEPRLSSTDQFAVIVSPTTHDFGALQVGQQSAGFAVDVNPSGTAGSFDTINSITENCPDFSVNAPGLPTDVYRTCEACPCATGSCPIPANVICCTSDYLNYTFTTFYAPTTAATTSCVVNINLASGITKTVTLSGTGTPPPIRLVSSPASYNFGDIRRNTDSGQIDFTVSNAGGMTMTVSSIQISAGFAIQAGPTGTYALGPGASQGYKVVCHPTGLGPISGNFTINSNDPTTPTKNIPLACKGVDSALDFAPTPVALPTTRVGEPNELDVEIKNTGTAPMSFEGVTLSGADFQMVTAPPNGSVPVGGGKTARVRYMAAAAGMASGTLTATFDGGQQRATALTAKAVNTSMALTPDGDVEFGPVCAGQTKKQSFTIVANDEGSFKVSSLAAPALPFTVENPALPANVVGNAGNMYTFDVTAAPAEAGVQTSTMTLTTDIPGATPRTVNLSVEGLQAGVSPTPATVDFGSTMINTTTLGQKVNVTNCSTSQIAFMNAHIEGADDGEFAIVASPESSQLMATGTATWLVVMTTHASGPKHAEFVVDYDGGQARVGLDGEGLADGVGSGDDDPIGESSYYACSTGAAHGIAPIALALGFVARRRRRARG